MREPNLFAFDFDGVLCDGLQEYFQVAWRTYAQISQTIEDLNPLDPPTDLFADFAQGRAIIETGWEMPLLVHALRQERSVAEILDHWPDLLAEFQALPQIPPPAEIAQQLDQIRDHWIQTDLTSWLALHQFYPGVIETLQRLLAQGDKVGDEVAIVSTKEGRFIQQLLANAQVTLPADRIFGKEVKRSKKETLKVLMAKYNHCQSVYFIEDRLAALQSIASDPSLQRVTLYLAAWGYNTAHDRDHAHQDDRIQLLQTIEDLPITKT